MMKEIQKRIGLSLVVQLADVRKSKDLALHVIENEAKYRPEFEAPYNCDTELLEAVATMISLSDGENWLVDILPSLAVKNKGRYQIVRLCPMLHNAIVTNNERLRNSISIYMKNGEPYETIYRLINCRSDSIEALMPYMIPDEPLVSPIDFNHPLFSGNNRCFGLYAAYIYYDYTDIHSIKEGVYQKIRTDTNVFLNSI